MILVEKKNIADIPLLHLVKQSIKEEKLPFIMFLHGFESAKEHNLHYAYYLAEKGIRVVLPEALYHGERSKQYSKMELNFKFLEIVLNGIKDIKLIKEYFEKRQLIDTNRIGLAGTSMGAISTLGAITQYDWIKVAVSLMGSPSFVEFLKSQISVLKQNNVEIPLLDAEIEEQLVHIQKYDLCINKEKLQNRPLLFWHGKRDPVVPFTPTFEFYKEIIPMYEKEPEKLRFIVDSIADHKVSRNGVIALVEWFEKFL